MQRHTLHKWMTLSPESIRVNVMYTSRKIHLDTYSITEVCEIEGCTAGRGRTDHAFLPDVRPHTVETPLWTVFIERVR